MSISSTYDSIYGIGWTIFDNSGYLLVCFERKSDTLLSRYDILEIKTVFQNENILCENRDIRCKIYTSCSSKVEFGNNTNIFMNWIPIHKETLENIFANPITIK